MGTARRQGLPFDAERSEQGAHADRTIGCAASPHCRLPTQLRRRFGGLGGCWRHYGPIGRQTTPLAQHPEEPGLHAIDDTYTQLLTPSGFHFAVGDSLDCFVLRHDPGHGAQRMTQTIGDEHIVGYRVYAVAWRSSDGPLAEWIAPGFGFAEEGYRHWFGETLPRAATLAELARLDDLLVGKRHPVGRPPRWSDQAFRDHVERAIARKTEQPHLPWDAIAEAFGISDRTLRKYRHRVLAEVEQRLRLVEKGDT